MTFHPSLSSQFSAAAWVTQSTPSTPLAAETSWPRTKLQNLQLCCKSLSYRVVWYVGVDNWSRQCGQPESCASLSRAREQYLLPAEGWGIEKIWPLQDTARLISPYHNLKEDKGKVYVRGWHLNVAGVSELSEMEMKWGSCFVWGWPWICWYLVIHVALDTTTCQKTYLEGRDWKNIWPSKKSLKTQIRILKKKFYLKISYFSSTSVLNNY